MKKILAYIILGAIGFCFSVSCQHKEDEPNPLVGTWQQVEYHYYGDTIIPGEGDATFIVFEKSKMKTYSSESEKCELILDIGYYLEDGFLWYDTGSNCFTRNESVSLSGQYLTITQENGCYDKYKMISKLPLERK